MQRFLFFLAIVFTYSGLSAQNFIKKFNSVSSITAVGSKAFFVADDDIHGAELWVTDGTPEGTSLLKDIYPGFNSSDPAYLTSFNGNLFFVANSLQYGTEVWKSDGTTAGTVLLQDILPGDANGSDPHALTVFNNELYFGAFSSDGFNTSVYKSDGTSAGTVLLKDMGFGRIADIEVAGDYLYYAFGSNGNEKLWRTDGTLGGTAEVTVDAYFYLKNLTAVGNQLFVTTSAEQNVDVRLYSLTGTNAPSLLKEFTTPASGTDELANLTAVGNKAFFSIQKNHDQKVDELWWSDGTVSGTVLVKSFSWDNSAMKNFFAFNGSLYFQNGSSQSDAWWKSDGSDGGTVVVSPVRLGYPSSGNFIPVVSDGKIYMSGDGELWISDGTASGTKEYYNINQSFSSSPSSLTDVNGLLYFAANDGYGNAIWNIEPSAEIDVLNPSQSSVLSGGGLTFEAVMINDCSSQIIEIRNVGAKELILSEISVSGKDFYIEGQLPAIVKSDQKFPITVYFLPFDKGERTGTLSIKSNDTNEFNYTIQLEGTGSEGTGFCNSFGNGSLKKSLVPNEQTSITINKNSIQEKLAAGTIIGTLSAAGSNTFSLVSGEGDTDNSKFQIDGTALKSMVQFDYDNKNIYTIRVKAQGSITSVERQLTIIVLKVPSNTLLASECISVVNRINSGLQDVEYNASGHLFVCGEGGKLLRSTDGGTTWTALNTGVTNQLTRLIFSGTNGYAAGDGVLLKSEDNGITWFQLYLPANAQVAPKTLFFLDADIGYVAGINGEIWKTTNGGVKWSSQGKHFSTAPTSLYFWNENDGIACTSFGSVHKTSSGGASWSLIDTSNLGDANLFTSITFIDNEDGFMTSFTSLFTSGDGGEHWTEVPGITGVFFEEVRFVTSEIGYVIGGSGELLLSTDGGTNWDVIPGNPITAATGIAYHSGSNKVVLVGANTFDLSSTEPGSVIMSSTEGTTTWEIKHELRSEDYYDVFFSSTNVGYVAGVEDIYKTTDGGLTWRKQNLQKSIYGISFLDDANGYMTDGSKVYSTTNGGTNWNEVYAPASADTKQVIALSTNAVIAYGHAGEIYSYNGTSWTQAPSPTVNQLQQIYFPTDVIGYGVDRLGKVIKSIDGGANWSDIYTHSASGESFNTIYFFNATEGLMAGVNGVMYKTTNGGANWIKVFSGISAEIKRIIFEDAQTGYAFTGDGTVFRSEDGGQTWTYTGVLPFIGLTNVSKSGTQIYFCGEYGSLGKLEPPKAPVQPGYIFGDQFVCDGDGAEYSVASNTGVNYYWNIPGAKVTANNDHASVQFNGAGQYTLTVQYYTSCGTSDARTLSITVNDPPQPVILGPQIVDFNSTVEFTVENPDPNNLYSWDVTGATSFTGNDESVSVLWGKDPGSVNVIETTTSGCRARETKAVTIDPSTIVGIDDSNVIEAGVNVYPNPTHNDILIESNLTDELNVRVYNLMGQQYDVRVLQPFSSNTLSLARAPKGMYLVEISSSTGKSRVVKKIIKD